MIRTNCKSEVHAYYTRTRNVIRGAIYTVLLSCLKCLHRVYMFLHRDVKIYNKMLLESKNLVIMLLRNNTY